MVEHSAQLDSVFKALADTTRRRMLADLLSGQRSVGELAEPHAMSLAGASKHVQVLERAGLVHRQKKGRQIVVSLEPGPMGEAQRWLATYSDYWSQRLDALEQALQIPEETKDD